MMIQQNGERTNESKKLQIVAACMTIAGSFLPWEVAGDLITVPTYGIRIGYSDISLWFRGVGQFPIQDNGGSLIILLTALLLLSQKYPLFQIRWIPFKKVAYPIFLCVASMLFITRLIYHHSLDGNIVGSTSPGVGLILVTAGSIILLVDAFRQLRNTPTV